MGQCTEHYASHGQLECISPSEFGLLDPLGAGVPVWPNGQAARVGLDSPCCGTRRLRCGAAATHGSNLSASDPRVHLGLGESAWEVDVGVVWPDGSRECWRALAINTAHSLLEAMGETWPRER